MSWTIAPTPISELLLPSSPRAGLAEHVRAPLGICKVGLMSAGEPAALGARQMEDELVEKVPMRDDSEHLFRPLEHKIGGVERTLTQARPPGRVLLLAIPKEIVLLAHAVKVHCV